MKGGASAIHDHEMQVRNLLKELEAQVEHSRGLGHWRIVDEQKISVLIRRIEAALPGELRMAEEILREREKRIRAAQEEAQRIIQEAEEEKRRIVERAQREAERKVAESEIVRLAEQKADELLRRAEQIADEKMRQAEEEALKRKEDAIEYAFRILSKLDQAVGKLKGVIAESIEELNLERASGGTASEGIQQREFDG